MDGAFYGSGSGHIFSLDCTNDENTATCDHNPVSDSSSCTHSNDVGLACIGMLYHSFDVCSLT